MKGKNTESISYTSFLFSFVVVVVVYNEERRRCVGGVSRYINMTKLNIIIVIISHHHNKSLYMNID